MNILLLGGLPEEYEGIPISADFRNMVQADLIMHEEKGCSQTEMVLASLHQLYPEIPKDIEKAINGLQWFFTRGEVLEDKESGEPKKTPEKGFSFNQDANLIYSAFHATYGINLATIEFLHWWEFMALFEGLPETTLIQRVMYWRTADLKDLSKQERKHILKMRKIYALKKPDKQRLSIEELDKQTKDRVARRYEEASAALARKEAEGGI